jgi:predicted dehydrogenase
VPHAQEIVKEAGKRKTILQVGHCIRFWPEYQALENFVKSKKGGRLISLNMVRRSGRPNYSSKNWLMDANRSYGALMDLHIHDTDFVHHLLGKPKAVTCFGNKDKRGWSHVFTRYHFPQDIAVTAEGGWNYPSGWGFEMSFQAIFENGVVDFNSNHNPTLRWTPENGKPEPLHFNAPQAGSSKIKGGNISSLGGYFNELKYFVECLEKNSMPQIATALQALESVRTVLAELKSAESGKTVQL